jgi:hypothetical protein
MIQVDSLYRKFAESGKTDPRLAISQKIGYF